MTISVDIPDSMREDLEEKKEKEYYSSMSELVREALREYLQKEEEELTRKEEIVLEMFREGKIEQIQLEGEAERKVKEGLSQMEEESYS